MKTLMLAITVFAIPAMSLAATYHYVDTTGEIADVQAASATDALTLSAADRAPGSGVALDHGILEEGDMTIGNNGIESYQYVDIHGDVQMVTADNASEALTEPNDIAPHSGVINTDVSVVTVDEVPL